MKTSTTSQRTLLWIGVGAALIAAALSFWRGGQKSTGYCLAELRALSEEEMIHRAIAAELFQLSGQEIPYMYDVVNGARVPVVRAEGDFISFLNKEEFRRLNPNCCAFVKKVRKEEVTRSDEISGRLVGFVTIQYLVRFRDSKGEVITHEKSSYWRMDNCGPKAD